MLKPSSLKIAITPLLVAAVSVATRWWGPTVGGILIGLPWFTGPVLLILILDRGSAFGVAACLGIEIGVVCVSAFMLAYGLVAAVAGWPRSLAAGLAAFFGSAALMPDPAVLAQLIPGDIAPLWTAAGIGAASLVVILALLPRPRGKVLLQAPPWWDIPARMATAAVLVAVLVASAEALGPRLAGILSTYPLIVSITGAFTHHRWGRDAVWHVLRGVAASLFSFVAFFLVVGLALPSTGAVGAYALAAMTALVMTAGLVAAHRLREARSARPLRQPS
jgi:hypothetical protein